MAKGCALSPGYLPLGGLHRNSVDRITDRPDMTSAVDRGRKATNKTSFIQDSADKHIQSKTSRSVSSVPWITPAIRRKIRR